MTGPAFLLRPRYDRSSSRDLTRNSAFAVVARVAPGVSTFLINLLIGRWGGSSLLGLTQTITATASLASSLYPTPAGMNASRSVSSSNARNDVPEAQAISRYLANRVLIASFLLAAGASVYMLATHGAGPDVVLMSAFVVLSVALRAFTEGLHFGGGESRRLAVWSTTIAVLSLAATITLLLLGVRTVWVIAPLVVLNLIFVAFSWPHAAMRLTASAIKSEIRRFIALAVVGTLASAGFTQMAVLLAATVNGFAYAGTYAAANTLTSPITMFASALGSVLFPALASAHASQQMDELRSRLRRSTSQLSTLVMFVCIPALILAGPVVSLLWGPAFEDTEWILLFSVPAVALGAIASPAVSSITAESNRGMAISAVSSLCGALVGIVVWTCTIPFFPTTAVPLGYLTGIAIVAIIPWVIAWKKFSMAWTVESLVVLAGLGGGVLASIVLRQTEAPLWLSIVTASACLAAWSIVRRRHLRESVSMLAALRNR